jgi:hypothetical protein
MYLKKFILRMFDLDLIPPIVIKKTVGRIKSKDAGPGNNDAESRVRKMIGSVISETKK